MDPLGIGLNVSGFFKTNDEQRMITSVASSFGIVSALYMRGYINRQMIFHWFSLFGIGAHVAQTISNFIASRTKFFDDKTNYRQTLLHLIALATFPCISNYVSTGALNTQYCLTAAVGSVGAVAAYWKFVRRIFSK